MENLFLDTNLLGSKSPLFTPFVGEHIFICSFYVKAIGSDSKAQEKVLGVILCYPHIYWQSVMGRKRIKQ